MDIRKLIDHTLLKPDASEEAIKRICDEAKEHGFKSVCVNPSRVGFVAEQLEGSDVLPCCVIGFPLGAAKDGNWELVKKDIEAVVTAANGEAAVKVIIETCLLTDEEKVLACQCAMEAGADFVKTSTGFSTGGATEHDVALMRKVVGENLGVKASGGVRTPEDAEKFINAGASRLGTSNGVKLLG